MKTLILRVIEPTVGGGGADAILFIENGICRGITYQEPDNYENYPWTMHPEWADGLFLNTEQEIQKFAKEYFDQFNDEHRGPEMIVIEKDSDEDFCKKQLHSFIENNLSKLKAEIDGLTDENIIKLRYSFAAGLIHVKENFNF